MERIEPEMEYFDGMPCSYVAVNCARHEAAKGDGGIGTALRPFLTGLPEGLRARDGYLTLADCNRYVRRHFRVTRRTDYKRGQRPKLKELHAGGRAIVVVLGHCIYVDGERYWSYFDNEDDDVVAVWLLDGLSE